jgi:hypothetical protein
VNHSHLPSRRMFLRAALATPLAGIVGDYSPLVGQDAVGDAQSVVARLTLDRELYNCNDLLNGRLYFRLPTNQSVIVRWIDTFGRVVHEFRLPNSTSQAAPQDFSFPLDLG